MEKIDKTSLEYQDIDINVDENTSSELLIKNLIDKINEIVDWINSQ
tara:strand:- start:466 stop:603 length:138 start_codon:yes stop_codon:yes gene_type:complete